MKYSENILNVASMNPDFMGFIFYSGSPRYVGENFIMPKIPSSVKRVGVFVNDPPSYIVDMVIRHDLDLVQLHGNESPALCEALSHFVGVIKSFAVDGNFTGQNLKPYEESCAYFLFDTKTEQHGGSGKRFDWSLLNTIEIVCPFFIGGGIGQAEIDELMQMELGSQVFGIDLNSKFELEPGLKAENKLKMVLTNKELIA